MNIRELTYALVISVMRWAGNVTLIVLAFLVCRTYVVQPFVVASDSMEPTLRDGDRLFVNRMAVGPLSKVGIVRKISRGDVVVFRSPRTNGKWDFVKRVVALPGETVEIRKKVVYINQHPLHESYTQFIFGEEPSLGTYGLSEYGPVEIPPASYFVLGDNRDHSEDSRVWGPLSEALIKGRMMTSYIRRGREVSSRASLVIQPSSLANSTR
jgi:signal peptidase I